MPNRDGTYPPADIHRTILVSNPPKYFPAFAAFKDCYLGMDKDQQERMQYMIQHVCYDVPNMGPLSAIELIWTVCEKVPMRRVRE